MVKRRDLVPYYVKGLFNNKYTLKQASESTGYSQRWLFELKKQYSINGDIVFVHKGIGRVAPNRIPESTREKIAALYGSNLYKDINFKYFCELLESEENIKVSLTTLKGILKGYGYISPEAHKEKKKPDYHRIRLRRANEGDLIQIDATPYPWFEKQGLSNYYCLTGGIDDATGKITGLYFTENECLYGYLAFMRQTLTNYGIPREIYSDRAAMFVYTPKHRGPDDRVPILNQLEGQTKFRTQFQRILDELGIRQILASSPQAKGRVERMWRTIQARLPTELALHGIKTIEEANLYLPKFIEKFNAQFSREAVNPVSFYRPSPDINFIRKTLCAKFSRRLCQGNYMSFKSYKMRVSGLKKVKSLELCISEQGLFALYDGIEYPVEVLEADLAPDISISMALQNIIYEYMYKYSKDTSF